MTSFVKISSPFVKKYEHSNVVATTSYVKSVEKAEAHQRRISVIIQNQGTTSVFFNSDGGNTGIAIAAGFTISFENYNGAIWLKGANGGETVHIAIAYS